MFSSKLGLTKSIKPLFDRLLSLFPIPELDTLNNPRQVVNSALLVPAVIGLLCYCRLMYTTDFGCPLPYHYVCLALHLNDLFWLASFDSYCCQQFLLISRVNWLLLHRQVSVERAASAREHPSKAARAGRLRLTLAKEFRGDMRANLL